MNETEQVKLEIERTADALTTKLGQIQQSFSPTHQIRKHPLAAVGISFGVGVIVGKTLTAPALTPAPASPGHGKSLVKSIAALAALTAAGRIGKKEFPEAAPHIETIETVVATKLAHSVAKHLSDAF